MPDMFFRNITHAGDRLHAKFKELGELTGRSFSEITTHVCMDPVEVTYLQDGTRIYRWAETGYEITMLFDHDDRCTKVTHECCHLFTD
jgi:hypothetical protein